ncbi:hypothetical protein LOTGIDRAFT_162494 [Lottia gigantea]|uniref:Uncharacterized protein n=1 Tax=Lottia gigantea TaxID=225164 RepID=V4BU75_LOTGI|nr:hypothetical protein LOTGIDRAFT_162494 [Lottia gigantea]ESO92584.1 hypothetical protein LOTGIDRAFT_162494 [Lottia gigantea]
MKPDQDYTELASQITEYSKSASKLLEDHKFEEAKSDFEEAYRISKLIRDPFTIRKCAFNLGAVYIRLCQARKGIEYLELAIPPDSVEDIFTNKGDLYFNIGLGYEMLKDYQNADSCFKKAFKDYRHFQENINGKMIEETLEKLAKTSRFIKNYVESADWSSELCQIYFQKGQEEKRIVTVGEQIVQLRKANEKEKCLILCDQIVCKIAEIIISPLTANMLNDVGLVLSQYERLNEAEKCYKKALSMVSALSSTEKLTAIILQNLGALYNITGQYHNSIDYHIQAAAKFGELKNGINEGHCYANMGYAYNQVGDLDKAKEYFLLALRKAKDNGDPHAEWQVLESLGSICCNLGNHDVAIKYYTDAFKAITKDSTSQTSLAEDRIQAKLFTLMKHQSEKQESTLQQQVNAQHMQEQEIMMLKQQLQQQAVINSKLQQQHQYDNNQMFSRQPVHINSQVNIRQPHVEHTVTEVKTTKEVVGEPDHDSSLSTVQSAPELLHSKIEHTRKELIKRRLKVRRSGSQREFDKVARGVYVSMGADVLDSLIKEEKESVHSSDFQFTDPGSASDTTISSLSSNSLDDPKSPQKKKKSIFKMIKDKAEQKLKLLERKKEDRVEEEPMRRNIRLARRQSEEKGRLLNHSMLVMDDEREQVKQAMRAHLQEDDEENSQQEKVKKKKYTKKSSPTQPLSSSSSSTSISSSGSSTTSSSSSEETTSDSETEEIEPQSKKSGPPNLPVNSPPQTLVNTYEEIPADNPHYTEIELDTSKAKPGLNSTSLSETVYETIQQSDSIDKLPTVNSPTRSDLSQMSRAERNSIDIDEDEEEEYSERFLYEQHLKSQQSVELPEEKEEKSKVCAIM